MGWSWRPAATSNASTAAVAAGSTAAALAAADATADWHYRHSATTEAAGHDYGPAHVAPSFNGSHGNGCRSHCATPEHGNDRVQLEPAHLDHCHASVAAAGTAAAGYSEAGLAAAEVKARRAYPPNPPFRVHLRPFLVAITI
jgi:hypothetical protein